MIKIGLQSKCQSAIHKTNAGKKEKPGAEVEGCEATILPNYFPSSPWHYFLIRVINSREMGKKSPPFVSIPEWGKGKEAG